MKSVLHVVDSLEYARTNCFQHQLMKSLHEVADVETVELSNVGNSKRSYDVIVSCLKQRTLFQHAPILSSVFKDTQVVVYDQDPWEAFRDGSPFKGAYSRISSCMNVKKFALTTRWWADYVNTKGFPTEFVRMWVLPEYCSQTPDYVNRKHDLGFVGTIHPYRQQLFDGLKNLGIDVFVGKGGLGYTGYMAALSDIKCFIHSENLEMIVDEVKTNLNIGLWIKDVEAAARGCFSFRNRGSDHESYLSDIGSIVLYDDIRQIPGLLEDIRKMDVAKRQANIDRSVEYIKKANRWRETANLLVLNSETTKE